MPRNLNALFGNDMDRPNGVAPSGLFPLTGANRGTLPPIGFGGPPNQGVAIFGNGGGGQAGQGGGGGSFGGAGGASGQFGNGGFTGGGGSSFGGTGTAIGAIFGGGSLYNGWQGTGNNAVPTLYSSVNRHGGFSGFSGGKGFGFGGEGFASSTITGSGLMGSAPALHGANQTK